VTGTLRIDFIEELPVLRLSFGALALAAALAVPFVVSAQSAPPPAAGQAQGAPAAGAAHHRHHAGNRYMRAMRGLNLSDVQKSQIRGIMKSARQANAGNGQALDPQTRRQNMIAMHQQIERVLSDTQRAQLHATLRAQRHANQAGAGTGAAPQAPPNQPQ
jgi:Spy/CpxP family protein refolding chaperone